MFNVELLTHAFMGNVIVVDEKRTEQVEGTALQHALAQNQHLFNLEVTAQ